MAYTSTIASAVFMASLALRERMALVVPSVFVVTINARYSVSGLICSNSTSNISVALGKPIAMHQDSSRKKKEA
jgi:hypothetical protein